MTLKSTLSTGVRLAAIAAMGLTLFGCAALKMPEPTASAENLSTLKAANLAPAKTGTFVLAPGKPADMDKSLGGLRAASLEPSNGSFSQMLKQELTVDLKSAGLYDESSHIVIAGQLTDSQVDAAIGTSSGRLAAHFTVTRDDKSAYDKEVAVDDKWDGAFIGAIAITDAVNHYTALYKALAGKLFADPDFQRALAK